MLHSPEAVRKRRQSVLAECRAQNLSEEDIGRRLTEADPNSAVGWLALGTAKLTAGALDEAEPILWRALELAPSNPGYYFPLASLYRARGEGLPADCLSALSLWKLSFYAEIPSSLVTTMREHLRLGDAASDPAAYEALAEQIERQIGDQPWPDRLIPYRFLNGVERQASGGLDPDLIARIRDHADACAPVFLAALREAADSKLASLSLDGEMLLMALLGEIGGVEVIDDLIDAPDGTLDVLYHSQWAVWRLGQRFPREAFGRLRALSTSAIPDVRSSIAQHIYLLPELPERRQAILQLLDGFQRFAADDDAPYLLLTVSSILAMLGAAADSLAVLRRHERQLSKENRRWLNRAIEEGSFVPDLIDFELDTLDIEAVCVERMLLDDEEEEEEEEEEQDEEAFEDDYEEPAPVPRPGRNDPCWCGSGKKYKKCHLAEDEAAGREERGLPQDVFAETWDQLLDFSSSFHRRSEVERAFELFFERSSGSLDKGTLAESGFFVWYVLDYRAAPDKRTVADEFLHRRGDRLPDRQRALVQSWRESRCAVWEVRRVDRGRGIEVKDSFDAFSCFVDDVSSSRSLRRGDLILGWIHFFEGKWLFAGDGLLVPPAVLPPLRAAVESGSLESGVTEAEYFRAQSHRWRRFIVETSPGPALVNSEGDPIEFSSAEYEVSDVEAVASALRDAPEFEESTAEDAPGKLTFEWLGETTGQDARRLYGHIEISGATLRIECNSRARLETGSGLLDQRCQGLLRRR